MNIPVCIKTIRTNRGFLFFLGILLGLFVFFPPPFQKPDEILHFKRAYALTLGQIICKFDSSHKRGYFQFPKAVDTFPTDVMANDIIMKTEGKFPINLFKKSYSIANPKPVDLLYNCNLPFTGYIPSAVGIILAIPFNNLLIQFWTARFCSALFFFIILAICFVIIPKTFRMLLLFSAILPMTLQQVSAVSYDSVSISMGFLLFTLWTSSLEAKKVSVRNFFVMCAVYFIFLFTKPGYYMFSLLIVAPLVKIHISLFKKITVGLGFFTGVIGIAWYALTLPI